VRREKRRGVKNTCSATAVREGDGGTWYSPWGERGNACHGGGAHIVQRREFCNNAKGRGRKDSLKKGKRQNRMAAKRGALIVPKKRNGNRKYSARVGRCHEI